MTKPTEQPKAPQISPQDVVHIIQGRARVLIESLDGPCDPSLICGYIAGMHEVAVALKKMVDALPKQEPANAKAN